MRRLSLIVRFLGLFASALFASRCVFHAINPEFEDFWSFCHWLGVVLLGVVVMSISLEFELSAPASCVTWRRSGYFLNRLELLVFYVWQGFFAMGGVTGREWTTLARVSGVVSWVTALANVTLAAAVDADDLGDEGEVLVPFKVPPKKTVEGSPPEVCGGALVLCASAENADNPSPPEVNSFAHDDNSCAGNAGNNPFRSRAADKNPFSSQRSKTGGVSREATSQTVNKDHDSCGNADNNPFSPEC